MYEGLEEECKQTYTNTRRIVGNLLVIYQIRMRCDAIGLVKLTLLARLLTLSGRIG
jgi:hypothetical protein